MPRTYVKKLGSKPYLNYNKENMEKAIEAVKRDMSKYRASQKFKVPRTTLIDKICENHPLKPGRPWVLTVKEEQLIAKPLGVVS
jgi:helix-turn-helix, Psq domain.